MAVRFQLRRDTAANWTATNPVLALGEPGVETDTFKVKVGDGTTAWNGLDYSITKDFTDLTNTPTTIAGYNITDALTLTALSVTDAGGDGSLSYDNGTGVFTYTGPSASEARAHFSAGTGVTYTAGAISIGQAVGTGDDVEFNKVTIGTIDSADSSAITIETDVEMLAGLTVGNHIVPSSNENIDLGSATNRFRELFLSGNTISLDSIKLSSEGGLLVHDGNGNRANINSHNIDANDITAAGNVDVTGNLTMTGYIAGPATFTIDPAAVGDNTGVVVIAGDLQVDGTTTTINSTTLEVEDKNVVLGPNVVNDAANNGAGITVTQPDTTDATLIYNTTDTQWELNKKLDIAGKVTSTDIDILSNNPRIRLDDSDTDNNAEVTLDNISLRIEVDEDDAIANSSIKFRVDADTKAIITSDGRLGIGYDSPADNIHILGSNASPNVGITLQSDDTANATAAISLFARNASNVNKISEIKNVAGQLFIERSDAGTDVLALKSTAAGAGGPQLDFYHHSASPADNDVVGTVNFNGWDDGSNPTTFARVSGVASDVTNGVEKGDLVFSTRRDGSTFDEKFRIAHEGYLVAQSASQVRLVLGSEGTYNNNTSNWIRGNGTGLGFNTAGGDYNWEVNGGNVMSLTGSNAWLGIGGITATKTLDVNGAIRTRTGGFNLAAGTTQVGAFVMHKEITGSGTDNSGVLFAETGLDLHFMTNGSADTKVIIDTAGNVGIGTDSPTSKLTVDSNISSSSTTVIDILQSTNGADKQVAGIGVLIDNGGESTNAGGMFFQTASGGALTERLRLTSSGSLELGYSGAARQQADGQALSIITPATGGGQGIALKRLDSNTDQNLGEISWSNNTQDGLGSISMKTDGAVNTTQMNFEVASAGTAIFPLKLEGGPNTVVINGTTADTGTTGGSRGLSVATAGGTSCPIYFGTETNSAQKSMYMTGYWIYLRGHQNEGIRFVFSQGAGSAPRSDQYEFKYNSATRPTGNTTWDGFSDARAKENVQDMTGALDTISQLRPVVFDWTDDYADTMNMFEMDKTAPESYNWKSIKENGYDLTRKNGKIGFIAQEFETVFPKDITELEVQLGDEKVEDFKTVNYDSLIPTLTKAIQEQQAQIQALQQRLDDLEG